MPASHLHAGADLALNSSCWSSGSCLSTFCSHVCGTPVHAARVREKPWSAGLQAFVPLQKELPCQQHQSANGSRRHCTGYKTLEGSAAVMVKRRPDEINECCGVALFSNRHPLNMGTSALPHSDFRSPDFPLFPSRNAQRSLSPVTARGH